MDGIAADLPAVIAQCDATCGFFPGKEERGLLAHGRRWKDTVENRGAFAARDIQQAD